MRREMKKRLSDSAASGIVALIFLVLGFQLAVFVMKVVRRPASDEGRQTESVSEVTEGVPASEGEVLAVRDSARGVRSVLRGYPRPQSAGNRADAFSRKPRVTRMYEGFPFDPNTVTLEDLVRLGLSERQAASVDNYRKKGGRFRGKQDFAKMYVVSDSLFKRLEPFIEIPKLEINGADSAALLSLNGIGPYFAGRIIAYRSRTGGFYNLEQLLDIERFDSAKLEQLRPQVEVDSLKIVPLDLWRLSEERLSEHPYVGPRAARAIQRFKRVYDSTAWTLANLLKDNILSEDAAAMLRHYLKE